MSDTPSFSAVLLAAGRSTRMGTDKALLPVDGMALWQRQWAVLARTRASEIILSVRHEQTWAPAGVNVVRDALADAGPLGGIAAALEKMRQTHLIVLAVDLPQMQPVWFERLKELCEPGVGAVGLCDGFYEPLAAIYPRELVADAVRRLTRGEYALQRFIAAAGTAMKAVEIGKEEAAMFENWNEPA